MEALVNLIETTPALAELAAAEDALGILSALNAEDRQRENHELQSSKAIVLRFGRAPAEVMLGGFKAAAAQSPVLDSMWIALSTVGLDFAHAETQQSIADLATAGVWGEASPEIAAQLQSLGVWYESPAFQHFGRAVAAEEVTEALAILTRRNLQRRLAARYTAVTSLILGGQVTTWEAALAALDDEGE